MKNFKKNGMLYCSLLEICSCLYIFYNFYCVKYISGGTMFNTILAFSVLFFSFLRGNGLLSKIFNNNFSVFLGASSYAIFIMHPFMRTLFKLVLIPHYSNFVHEHVKVTFAIMLVLCIVVGIVVHYLFEIPINKLIKDKLFSK